MHIGAHGIDTACVIKDIQRRVKEKHDAGAYEAAGLNDPERMGEFDFNDHQAFLSAYLENLREKAFVDIGDFEIVEKRPRFRSFLVRFKRMIWSVLRFYTYRLWSQQNQINGLLLAAIEGIHDEQKQKIDKLNARIAALEDVLKSH